MGDLGRSQVVSSSSVTESVFSFLAEQCNSFAILPHLASCCLEFSEVCQHFGSFSLVVDSNSVIIGNVDRSVNKVLLHGHMADKMHVVCENY